MIRPLHTCTEAHFIVKVEQKILLGLFQHLHRVMANPRPLSAIHVIPNTVDHISVILPNDLRRTRT